MGKILDITNARDTKTRLKETGVISNEVSDNTGFGAKRTYR